MRLLNRTLILVSLTSLLTDISSEMVYPLLPFFIVGTLQAPKSILGLIEGMAESLAQVLRVFAGAWSDRLGSRKPMTIAGYAASTIGKVLLFLAGAWPTAFLARVIDRFGKGVRSAPRDALIGDSVPATLRGRAFGFHRAMDTLGAAIGIVIAYLALGAGGGGIRTVLLWSILPAALGVVALTFVREPTAHDQRSRPSLRPLAAWCSLPSALKRYLCIAFLFTLGNSSNQFLLLRAQDRGFDERTAVLLYLLYTLVYAGASYPAGRLSDLVGRRALLVSGHFVYGVTYFGFALVGRLDPGAAGLAIWGLFTIYGLHIGLTEGVEKALLVDLAPADLRATVLGLNSMAIGLALLPASLFAGWMWDAWGAPAPFWLGGVMGILAASALAVTLRRPGH